MKLFICHPLRATSPVIFVLAALLLMQVACGGSSLSSEPQPAAENTALDDPSPVEAPVEASATFTRVPSKTSTPTQAPPTETPTKTLTATPKISRTPRPSMTASPTGRGDIAAPAAGQWQPDYSVPDATETVYEYECEILDQQPAVFTEFTAGASFDLVWEVRNIGFAQWEKDQYYFKYISGAHFEENGDRYEFDHLVGPGNQIKFAIDFVAPEEPGIYETYWGIVNTSTDDIACELYLALKVK